MSLSRRAFLAHAAGATALLATTPYLRAADAVAAFKLNYIVASSMYGKLPLADVLPEVRKVGATQIDVWPEVHANHREQIDEMGPEKFAAMLKASDVSVGIYTCYNPGLFKVSDHMDACKRFGGSMVIANCPGPKNLTGDDLKREVAKAAEKLKPHVEKAESLGMTIGVENHSGSLVNSPESQLVLCDLIKSQHVGIALAPYHLDQDAAMLSKLITDLGDRLAHVYAWQHGMGCMTKLPKEQELLQMPGRGDASTGALDFTPLIAAMKKVSYKGWISPFMHPVPRGIPIYPTAAEVTAEINRSRKYLDACAAKV